jgi:hypothetical protein
MTYPHNPKNYPSRDVGPPGSLTVCKQATKGFFTITKQHKRACAVLLACASLVAVNRQPCVRVAYCPPSGARARACYALCVLGNNTTKANNNNNQKLNCLWLLYVCTKPVVYTTTLLALCLGKQAQQSRPLQLP